MLQFTHFGLDKLQIIAYLIMYYEIGGFYFRNGMGFVRFMYEGQIAYARVCGRDFLMKSSDDWLTGSLPPLQSNQEIGTYLYD